MTTTRNQVALALALVTLVASGCGNFISRATYAKTRCEDCKAKVLLTDEPLTVYFSYPGAKDPEAPPPDVRFTCNGAPCKSTFVGVQRGQSLSGMPDDELQMTFSPAAAGTVDVVAAIQDATGEPKTWHFGPYEVLHPDRIAITCTVTRGRETAPRGPELHAEDDVRLEIGLYAGDRRVQSKSLETKWSGPYAPNCAVSATASDGAGPILACNSSTWRPGDYTLAVKRADLHQELRFTVR